MRENFVESESEKCIYVCMINSIVAFSALVKLRFWFCFLHVLVFVFAGAGFCTD